MNARFRYTSGTDRGRGYVSYMMSYYQMVLNNSHLVQLFKYRKHIVDYSAYTLAGFVWILLWGGIAKSNLGDFQRIWDPSFSIYYLNVLRILVVPCAVLISAFAIAVKLRNGQPRNVSLISPLSFMMAYGSVGIVVSSLSPDWKQALFWAVSYCAVPIVLWAVVWGYKPIRLVYNLIFINWIMVFVLFAGLLVVALINFDLVHVLINPSYLWKCERLGSWLVLSEGFIRSTGVGRFSAVIVIISFSLLFKKSWWLVLWTPTFYLSLTLLMTTGARTSLLALALSASTIALLHASRRAIVMGCIVLLFLIPVTWYLDIPQTFLNTCILKEYDSSGLYYLKMRDSNSGGTFERAELTNSTIIEESTNDFSEIRKSVNLDTNVKMPQESLVHPVDRDDEYQSNIANQVSEQQLEKSSLDGLAASVSIPSLSPKPGEVESTISGSTLIDTEATYSKGLIGPEGLPENASQQDHKTHIQESGSEVTLNLEITGVDEKSTALTSRDSNTKYIDDRLGNEKQMMVSSEEEAGSKFIDQGDPSVELDKYLLGGSEHPDVDIVDNGHTTRNQASEYSLSEKSQSDHQQVELMEKDEIESKTSFKPDFIPTGFWELSGRTHIWAAGLGFIKKSPVLGYGFQADRLVLGTHIHNALLNAMIQTGLVGTIPFVLSILMVWVLVGRIICRLRRLSDFDRLIVIQIIGILVFLTIRGTLESSGSFFGIDWLLLAPILFYIPVIFKKLQKEEA